MRYSGVLLIAALLGCVHSGTEIHVEEDEHFSDYHHIGIPAFTDSKGQGDAIAETLSKAFQSEMVSEPIDRVALEQALSKYKVGLSHDIDVEALEQVRVHTSVDAIIFGQMTPDWSGARVVMIDAKMGVPVFRILAKPAAGKKVFTTPNEITQEILRAIANLH